MGDLLLDSVLGPPLDKMFGVAAPEEPGPTSGQSLYCYPHPSLSSPTKCPLGYCTCSPRRACFKDQGSHAPSLKGALTLHPKAPPHFPAEVSPGFLEAKGPLWNLTTSQWKGALRLQGAG